MSRLPPITLTSAAPKVPEDVSNKGQAPKSKKPTGPLTVHLGGLAKRKPKMGSAKRKAGLPKSLASAAIPSSKPTADAAVDEAKVVLKKAAVDAVRNRSAAQPKPEKTVKPQPEKSKAKGLAADVTSTEAGEGAAKSKAEATQKTTLKPTPVPSAASTPVPDRDAAQTPMRVETAQIPSPKQAISEAPTPHQARADIVLTLAAHLGAPLTQADVLECFAREPDQEIGPAVLAEALELSGLSAQVSVLSSIKAKAWPALAEMTSGHLILVLSQEGDSLTIYDPTTADKTADVPVREFAPYFSGTVVRAGKTLASLSRTYAPAALADHWFWGQFGAFKRQIGEIALGSLVANLLAVAVALFSLQVYDRVIPHKSEATLWVLALGAVAAVCLEAVIKFARSRLMDGSGRQIEVRVQSLLMERVLGMRSDARPTSPSGLFSAMREFSSVREFFTASTIGTVADIPFIFLFFALVASIAGPVVWVLILGAIIMVVPGYFFQKRMMRLTVESQGASARASRLLHEAVFELDTLKTQRGEARVRRIWDELNVLGSAKSSEQRKLSGLLTFWSQGVQQVTYLAAVVLGTYLVFAGEFTVGTIIATGILTSRTLAPLTQLSGTMARWTNVKTALEGLDAIALSEQEATPDRNFLRRDTIAGAYALREMQFRYDPEGAPTLDIPAMDIKPGQKIAILGSNGSGKSSLLKVLAGLYAPSTGRVILDGAEMSQIDPRDVRRSVGYLGQDVRLFAGTLRDNLNLGGLERDDNRLLDALDFAGIGPFVRGHHRGLDLEIRDGGEGLSVGQRQSIGWARLWLQDPTVCLLDEPTAAFDQALETAVVGRLEPWLRERTALIATHRMPIVGLADRTMVLKNGRLMVDGPRDQVLAHLGKK